MSEEIKRVLVPRGHSLTTAKLIEILEKGAVGDVLTDEKLSGMAGKDCSVKGKGYPSLMSAIRWCISQHAIHWQRIAGSHAIKCVTSVETVEAVESNIHQVKRRMHRTLKLSRCVKLPELKTEDRTKFLAMVAQAGTIEQFAGGAATKALASRNVKDAIDFGKTLELMASKNA